MLIFLWKLLSTINICICDMISPLQSMFACWHFSMGFISYILIHIKERKNTTFVFLFGKSFALWKMLNRKTLHFDFSISKLNTKKYVFTFVELFIIHNIHWYQNKKEYNFGIPLWKKLSTIHLFILKNVTLWHLDLPFAITIQTWSTCHLQSKFMCWHISIRFLVLMSMI